MRYGRLLIWSAVGAALTSPALAQEGKRFQVQLNARVVHDDNVARSNAALAALRGIEQEDVLFSPSLSVDLEQPVGRQSLFLKGSAGYNFYNKNEELNREQISLRGGVNSVFGPCVTILASDFKRQQSELDDLDFVAIKNVETITSVSLGASCGRSVGFVPIASVSQQWADNSAAQRQTANYEATVASAGVSYRRPTFGELTLAGNYGKTEYDRLVVTSVGPERDGYESYGGSLRYARQIGARLRGTVSVGYTLVQPLTADTDEFEGITYATDLTYQPSSRVQVQASFTRAVNPSNRIQTTYAVEDIYAIQGTYSLGSRIKLGLGGSYTDSSYEGDGLVRGLSITDEQTKSIFGSVRFNFNQRLGVTLDASQQERDANIHGLDYTANRIGLSIVATY